MADGGKGIGMTIKSGTEGFDDLVTTTLPALVGEASAQGGRLYRSVMARVEQPLLRHALELCGGGRRATSRAHRRSAWSTSSTSGFARRRRRASRTCPAGMP